jgi:hypothetical protein
VKSQWNISNKRLIHNIGKEDLLSPLSNRSDFIVLLSLSFFRWKFRLDATDKVKLQDIAEDVEQDTKRLL